MEQRNQRRLLLALVLLLASLVALLVKDRTFWFGVDETADVEESSPAAPHNAGQATTARNSATPTPTPAPAATSTLAAAPTPTPAPRVAPAPKPSLAPAPAQAASAPASKEPTGKTNKSVEASKVSPAPPAAAAPAQVATRAELPPMEVEVVSGDTHKTIRPGSNSIMVSVPTHSKSRSPMFKWSPVTNAAELTRVSSDQNERLLQSGDSSYPALARQMRVEGSVVLQAFVAADGAIRDLRVLSGNPILVPAAVDAARQWRFAPYLQNGQPVATQAKIMINFSIKVL